VVKANIPKGVSFNKFKASTKGICKVVANQIVCTVGALSPNRTTKLAFRFNGNQKTTGFTAVLSSDSTSSITLKGAYKV